MISVTIHKPVWFNRTISIRKDLVLSAEKQQECLQIKIEAKPYDDYLYYIDPYKVLSIGKPWMIKGKLCLNFKISELEIINETQ